VARTMLDRQRESAHRFVDASVGMIERKVQ
jgi:hypothetical protein